MLSHSVTHTKKTTHKHTHINTQTHTQTPTHTHTHTLRHTHTHSLRHTHTHSDTHTHTHTHTHTRSDTPHSVGLLWARDRPVGETTTSQHTTLTRDRIQCLPWDSNPQFQQASGRRPNKTAQPLESAMKYLCQIISYSHYLRVWSRLIKISRCIKTRICNGDIHKSVTELSSLIRQIIDQLWLTKRILRWVEFKSVSVTWTILRNSVVCIYIKSY